MMQGRGKYAFRGSPPYVFEGPKHNEDRTDEFRDTKEVRRMRDRQFRLRPVGNDGIRV